MLANADDGPFLFFEGSSMLNSSFYTILRAIDGVVMVGDTGLTPIELSTPARTEIPGGGRRGRLYLAIHCHHQNDSCIKMGGVGSSMA